MLDKQRVFSINLWLEKSAEINWVNLSMMVDYIKAAEIYNFIDYLIHHSRTPIILTLDMF